MDLPIPSFSGSRAIQSEAVLNTRATAKRANKSGGRDLIPPPLLFERSLLRCRNRSKRRAKYNMQVMSEQLPPVCLTHGRRKKNLSNTAVRRSSGFLPLRAKVMVTNPATHRETPQALRLRSRERRCSGQLPQAPALTRSFARKRLSTFPQVHQPRFRKNRP